MGRFHRVLPSCRFAASIGIVVLLNVSAARAEGPALLTYQGRLSDAAGSPRTGTFTIVFTIYDALTGGNQLPAGTPWIETHAVPVTDGAFTVQLGSVTQLPPTIFAGGPFDSLGALRFLQVTVNGEVLAPRSRVGSAPYVLNSVAGATGPAGPTGSPGPTGPPGPPGPIPALTCTQIVQNYRGPNPVEVSCPADHWVFLASCSRGIGFVMNSLTDPVPIGATQWDAWLIPNANSPTGVHCQTLKTAIQTDQIWLRCCRLS